MAKSKFNISHDYAIFRIVNDERYLVFYYSFENFQKVLKEQFPNINVVRRLLTRAFTDGEVIYALDKFHWYSSIAHDKLLEHEVGHIKGEQHTWKPTLMNPSWLFRWF